MDYDNYYQLGHISKTFGLAGGVVIFLDVTEPDYYQNLDAIFIDQQGELIPFGIRSIQINGKKAKVILEEVSTRDMAGEIVGHSVYLPLSYLPRLDEGYYFHDLIGLKIISDQESIGIVEKLYDLGNQHLLSTSVDGKEVMIPLTTEIVHTVNLEKGEIHVDLPDGLIDLYLES